MAHETIPLPEALKSQLKEGRVVPFLGAGLGIPCGLPNWENLLRLLVDWIADNGLHLPNQQLIADAIKAHRMDGAAHAIGEALGSKLPEALRSILAPRGIEPTPVHRLLTSVIWPAVLTTNFDNLLSTAFNGRIDSVTWRDSARMGELLRTGVPHLMMVHGWIDQPDSIVLTPQGYRESFHSPSQQHYLSTLMSNYSFLFVGCSLTDPDIKYFLDELRHAFGVTRVPHFALLAANQVDALEIQHRRENYDLHIITYSPRNAGHPEVEEFLRATIDLVPQRMLYDPAAKVEGLAAARSSKDSASADEYLQGFSETCNRLAEAGFLRTAWSELRAELLNTPTASIERRLETLRCLVELMRTDQAFAEALQSMEQHRILLTDPMLTPLQVHIELLRFQTLIDAYGIVEATDVCKELISRGASPNQSNEMQETLAIANFLHSGLAPESAFEDSLALMTFLEAHAMQGGLDKSLAALAAAADKQKALSNTFAAIELRNKRAELLHLSCQNQLAWEEFEQHIVPYQDVLSREQVADLQDNQTFVGFMIGKYPAPKTLRSGDLRMNATDDAKQAEYLLEAETASRQQKHYDSLPPLWRNLRRAHRGLRWGSRYIAHSRLAWETFAAGWIPEATHHAILGKNEDCCQKMGEYLTNRGSKELVAAVVDYLLVTCQLAHHLQTARPLVCSIKDILPEEKLPELVAWLLRTANQVIVDHDAEQCAIAAWKVLTEIAYRIPFLTAVGVLQAARSHHFFLHQHRFGRAAILRAIDALVGLGTASDLRELAQELLPAATTNKWDYDYAEALHVLATIVRRSPETKESIHAALFNQKTASTDVKLASYAEVFGHQIKPETLKVSVSKIAEHLARQVQIAPPEPSTFLLHSFGTRDITATTGSIRIAMRGGAAELDYVVSNKSLVPTQSLEELVNTVIDLIQNRFNDRANRTMLMEFLVRVRDRLSSEQCARASACLAKFAVDEDKEAVSDLPVPSTTDRMKWHGTSPAEQRATALRAMALLTQDHPECFNSEMYALLLDGVLHQESLIRRVACASIGDLAAPPSTLLIPLLLASLDCDFEVAGTALHAATRVLHSVDVQANASLLIAIASKTSTAPKALVRGLSAKFSAVLRRQPLAPEHQMAIAVLRAALQTDISFEVRRAATD